jgi:hypothetical protein
VIASLCAFVAGSGLTASVGFVWLHGRSSAEARGDDRARAATPAAKRQDRLLTVPVVDWTLTDVGDVSALMDRLRKAGYPSAVVQGLATALVREKFLAKRRLLQAHQPTTPFWRKPVAAEKNAERTAALHALAIEEARAVSAVMGEAVKDFSDAMSPAERALFGSIPPDKMLEVRAVRSDYGQMRSEILAEAEGNMLPQDLEKLGYLEKAEREDLARVLSPKELEEYDVRASNTANSLRKNLALFEPSEEEFRAIFAARRAVEDKFGPLGAGQTEQILAREREVYDRVKEILPSDRMAQYAQTTDPFRLSLNRVASRFGLPLSSANAVAEIQKDTLQQASRVSSNRNLAVDQRESQLAVLSQQAKGKVSSILGADAYQAYLQSGGAWLQLQSRPASAPLRAGFLGPPGMPPKS